MNEEYKAEVAQYMEKLDKNFKKLRRKICSQIADYTESFIEENVQWINKYLASIEGKMFDSVKTIIEARVTAELERQQKMMTKLIEDSKAFDALRDEKLQKANAAIESVKRLLGCVAELEIELEEMHDIIEED